MLRYRIISGTIIGAFFFMLPFWVPAWGILIVVGGLAAWTQYECYAMLRKSGSPVYIPLGILSGMAYMTAVFCCASAETATVAARNSDVIVLAAVIGAILLRPMFDKEHPRPIEAIGGTLLGFLMVPFMLSFFFRLAFGFDGAGITAPATVTGRNLALFTIIVVKVQDIGAYFTGRFLGKHKMAPRISPKKSLEGLAGGLITSMLVAALFYHLVGESLGIITPGWGHIVFLGLLLGATGVIGDLFESYLKRACSTKDSSASVPGMGGIFDVIDSLLPAAPVMFVYTILFLL